MKRAAILSRCRFVAGMAAVVMFCLLLMAGGATSARAQGTNLLPVRIKLGILNLQDGDARKIAGNPLYLAEADLDLPASGGSGRSILSAGFQYRTSHGNTLRVIPITTGKIFSLSNVASTLTGSLYYGVGAGLYLMHGTSGGSSESKTSLGGYAVAGYQFPGSYFAEAKYQLVSGSVKGGNANGVLFALGKRF